MLPTECVRIILCVWWWMVMVCNIGGHVLRNANISEPDGNVIHCYCNLPSCITTNYMCKSEVNENGCFKKFDLGTEQYYYGCLQSTIKQTLCPESGETTTNLSVDTEYYQECCYSDMCNSESSDKQFNTIQLTNIRINESDEEKIKEILLLKNINRISSSSYYSNSEIWFRAVLITVPVCGLMILLILIFVAIRLLKSDVPDDRKSSSKLIKQKYETTSVDNTKLSLPSIPETQGFCSQLIPKYNVFDRKFLFVFRPQEKNQNAKNAKYLYVSTDVKDTNNLNYVPKVPEKFAKQNLNILKLPYKFNELKHKSDKNVNVNVNSNNNCYSIINPVTLNFNSTSLKKI